MIENGSSEGTNDAHPSGVREVPIAPPIAAVANAMHNALVLPFRELPMSPPKILAAMDGDER